MKHRCKMRQKSKSLHYQASDVDKAIEFLTKGVKSAKPLVYSPQLSSLCHKGLKLHAKHLQAAIRSSPFDSSASSQSITKLDESPLQQPYLSSPDMSKTGCNSSSLEIFNLPLKELTVEFIGCREDLLITTVREFLEIIVMSIIKQQSFHYELMSP